MELVVPWTLSELPFHACCAENLFLTVTLSTSGTPTVTLLDTLSPVPADQLGVFCVDDWLLLLWSVWYWVKKPAGIALTLKTCGIVCRAGAMKSMCIGGTPSTTDGWLRWAITTLFGAPSASDLPRLSVAMSAASFMGPGTRAAGSEKLEPAEIAKLFAGSTLKSVTSMDDAQSDDSSASCRSGLRSFAGGGFGFACIRSKLPAARSCRQKPAANGRAGPATGLSDASKPNIWMLLPDSCAPGSTRTAA